MAEWFRDTPLGQCSVAALNNDTRSVVGQGFEDVDALYAYTMSGEVVSTVAGVSTRAVATTGTLTDFTVYSFIQGTRQAYMNDVKVSKNRDRLWQYSPTQYWPRNDKLNFYSFAPSRDRIHCDPASADGSGPDIPNFVNDGSVDLLYGVNMGLDDSTPQVKINFRHALSRVHFQVVPKEGPA